MNGTKFSKPHADAGLFLPLSLSLTRVGYVCGAQHALDLVHVIELRAEPAVHAEDLLVHDSGHGQAVEAVRERLPQLDVVPALACGDRPVSL